MAKAIFTCAHCGKTAEKERGQLNRIERNGHNPHCSKACADAFKLKGRKALGWHERRFEARPNTVHANCEQCGKDMWLPPCKAGLYKRCSSECNEAWRASEYAKLLRECATCGKEFRPRPTQVRNGTGRFCSQRCNTEGREAMHRPEVKQRSIETMRQLHAAGLVKIYRGEDHPQWKGGPAACVRRRIEDGRAADTLRRYRKANPDKVREFKHRRDGRKIGKLPYGTIPKIRKMQRDKCAICTVSLKDGYHLDHILPLADIGIQHLPVNVWLGITVVNQQEANRDVSKLLEASAAIKFLSIEPMQGEIILRSEWLEMLDWIICGGESGPGARPMHPAWARLLRDQCDVYGVAYLFKQWGEWAPSENCTIDCTADALIFDATAKEWRKSIDGGWIGDQAMCRVGKKRAGRLLDGVEHNGFPNTSGNGVGR